MIVIANAQSMGHNAKRWTAERLNLYLGACTCVASLEFLRESVAAMLAFRKTNRDLVRLTCCIFQAAKLSGTAVSMGEDCCGVAASPAVPEQANGRHANGAPAGRSNFDQRHSLKSHKEAAEELQGWIGRRIELFDQFSERHKREVGPAGSA